MDRVYVFPFIVSLPDPPVKTGETYSTLGIYLMMLRSFHVNVLAKSPILNPPPPELILPGITCNVVAPTAPSWLETNIFIP